MKRSLSFSPFVVTMFTLARVGFAPLLVLTVLSARDVAGGLSVILVVAAAVVTDWLDGQLARRAACDSRLRRVLDQGVDKLIIHSAFLALWFTGALTWPLLSLLVLRDSIVVLLNVAAYRTIRTVFYPSLVHKLAVAALATGGAATATGLPYAKALLVSGIAFYGLTGLDYLLLVGLTLAYDRGALAALRRAGRYDASNLDGVSMVVQVLTTASGERFMQPTRSRRWQA